MRSSGGSGPLPRKSSRTLSGVLGCLALCCCIPWGCPPAAGAFELMLDPGHSPKSPGAVSCGGVPEYRYNNELTAFLARSLSALPRVRVRLSRNFEDETGLADRVRETEGVDLMISIHHDSVQPRYLDRTAPAGAACSRKAEGFSIFVSRANPFFDRSLAAARTLAGSLKKQGLRPSLHHAEPIPGENRPLLDRDLGIYAFDDLVVLKKARSPALLLEAGVIVNPSDEKRVVEPGFRNKIAAAVRAAIESLKKN